MPRGSWSAKDERQYGHIKDSCLASGRGKKACQRMAAATVNRDRGRGLGEVVDGDRIDADRHRTYAVALSDHFRKKSKCRVALVPGRDEIVRICRDRHYTDAVEIQVLDNSPASFFTEQGAGGILGSGLFSVSLSKMFTEEGVEAVAPSVENLILTIAQRFACTNGLDLVRYRPLDTNSNWWNRRRDRICKDGMCRIPACSAMSTHRIKAPRERAPTPPPPPPARLPGMPRGEYHDQGYEMAPFQLRGARCRTARVNRNQKLEVCTNRELRQRDVRVVDKTGAILGKGYFSDDNDTLWTIGVKGTPEARFDIELMAARLACARKQNLASGFDPFDSYFWRAQIHAGRARASDVDDGASYLLSAKDACAGTPQYSPRGLVESLKRRPMLLTGLPRMR